jgi:FixJ family two-component response regulator
MPTPKPVLAVLDDEPEMRKALRRLLTGHGFCVEEYARGNDLLAALGSRPLDCLLLDLHMEEVSGFDVLEAFHSRHIRVPVIVITAHDEPGTAARRRARLCPDARNQRHPPRAGRSDGRQSPGR